MQPDATPPKPDDPNEVVEIGDDHQHLKPASTRHPNHWHRLEIWWKSLNRNVRFGVIAAGLLVFGAAVLGIYYFTSPQGNPSLEIIKHEQQATATTVPSPLTGVQVSPALAARPVTGIMIENSTFARPQSGLQDAGVVYEAIAEAGITRFLALFQENTPAYIGPVRSLRPYFIDYAAPFQASIVHVGGSPSALREVESGHFRNLDEFFNGGSFWRISSREAPHNVYTSFAKLDALEKSKGYTKSKFYSWTRKADSKKQNPTVTSIDLTMSGPDYNVHYDYDATTNKYLRSEGGKRHTDTNSKGKEVRLQPKVVIALVVPLHNGSLDATGAYYSDYITSGKGLAYVFQDGGVTKVTWTKSATGSQLRFLKGNGQDLALNAGQTWITLVSGTGQVHYGK